MSTQDGTPIENSQPETGSQMSLKHRILVAVGSPMAIIASLVLSSLLVWFLFWVADNFGVPFHDINQSVISSIEAALLYSLAIAVLVGIPLIIWRKPLVSLKELGLDRLPIWKDIFITPVAFVFYIIMSATLVAIATGIPGFDAEQAQDVGFDSLGRGYEYTLAFLTLVALAPFAEEVLLRGYLYGKLRKVMPVALAVIISSSLFGLLHGQWNVAIDTFMLGVVMASLREVTGSIWAGILLHALKNGIAFYFLFVNPSILDEMLGIIIW